MNNALEVIITRSRTVLSTLVFLFVAGTIAYIEIPKEAEPEFEMPFVFVNVALEGVSPVDAERLLVRPLEEQFKNLEGVKTTTAKAFQGGASVSLEFDAGFNTDYAVQEVRTKVDMARPEMPTDMEEPRVNELDMSHFPMMVVTLSGDLPERSLLQHARLLRDEVKIVQGVLDATITGIREEVVEIIIDPTRAQSYRLNSDDLFQVFSRANRLVAAGKLDTGQGSFAVTVPGLFETGEDILNMPVKVSGNAVVRVKDVADIRRTFKDADAFVRVNGERAVAVEIVKRRGQNMIITSESVRRIVDRARTTWPANLAANITQDQSTQVDEQVGTLQNSVLLAIFLVMAAVIAALGLRAGFLVGVSIPGSFLLGILFIFVMGMTVNSMVMFGLILSVGILVDGAIVVTEYADRKMNEGLDRRDAYVMAAQRMSWPIISSTATTIAAFVPLLFWPGFMGQLMFFMPVTIICVLIASLLMALVFVPSLGRQIGKPSEADAQTMAALSGSESVDVEQLRGVTKTYVRVLSRALRHPGKVVAGMISSLFAVMIIYGVLMGGITFFPEMEVDQAAVVIHSRGNLSVEEKNELIQQVEQRLLGLEGVKTLYARTGGGGQDAAPDVIGQITLIFLPWDQRPTSSEILKTALARTSGLAGIHVATAKQRHGFGSAKPVEIELTSAFSSEIAQATSHVRRGMNEIGGFTNVEDTRPLPGIEWRLDVDRAQAARFGADLTSVGSAVRLITNGMRLGTFRPDDSEEEIDIIVRYPMDFRSMTQLDELRIETNKGLVPISNFVTRVPVQQETQIDRIDGRRIMSITSDVEDGYLANDKVSELRAWLAANPVNERVRVSFKGDEAEQRENGNFLLFAFAFGLFLMAGILLIEFNSFYSVLLILSSVILSTIGVLFGYMLLGIPFNVVMSGMGLIALAGIVVNNNIVLLDTYERLVKTAPTAFDALVQTGAQRLRPVFLTTLTTVLGLVPMANQVSIDFFSRSISFGAPAMMWWQEMSLTIIFGLIFATILTLVVTPCAVMLQARRSERKRNEPPLPAGVIPAE